MVKVLSVLVLVFSIVQSCCEEIEVVGDLTIHCGQSDTSIVNITYYGDISIMFIEDKYEECSSLEISPAHHVIYNINNRDCGFVEFNNTNTWTVTVRLQKGFLVTTADKKVNLVCAYDDDVVGGAMINSTYDPVQPQQTNKINTENVILQNEAQIKVAVIDVLSDMINGQTNVTVEVLDENREPVTILNPDVNFRLRITFPTLLASTFNSPVVQECMFSSPSQEHIAYLIHNGCGNIRFTSVFNPIENGEVKSGRFLTETAEFKIPKIWLPQHDSVSIFCKVIICKKALKCSQLCPLPNDIRAAQKDDILKIEGRTQNLTLHRMGLPSSQPPIAGVEKLTDSNEEEKTHNYLPYLIIAIVLVVIFIVFTAILICVIREQIKANQSKDSDILKRLAVVDPNRRMLLPLLQEKKKTKISKVGKSWFKKLRSQQINGVGYPCLQPTNYLIPTNNPNQPFQIVSQPHQFINQSQPPPARTQHYFVDPPPQNNNFGSQTIHVNQPIDQPVPRSNSIPSNVDIQPYQSNASIYPQQNPLDTLTRPFSVGNVLFQTDARAQPFPTNAGILPPSVNQPFQLLRPYPSTQPVQFVNTGFPHLSSPAGVQPSVIVNHPPQTANPIRVDNSGPTYIGPLPRAQSYPTFSNAYGRNGMYDIWPPNRPRQVPVGFSDWIDDWHYYPPPWWPVYDEHPVDDPRYHDPYLHRYVHDDGYRRHEEHPHSYNRPLARTTSLIDVMGSVLNDDRRRRRGRKYYSDFDLNIPRSRDRHHDYQDFERPRHYDYYDSERPHYRF